MTEAASSAPSKRARWNPDSTARRESAGPSRLRLNMIGAFLIVAVAMVVQATLVLRLDELRSVDLELVDRAAQQRTLVQQIARQAALLLADPQRRPAQVEELSALLIRSGQDALALEDLLTRHVSRADTPERQLRGALEAWQAARERLWYRAESMLGHVLPGDDGDLADRVATVQTESDAALAAAQQLTLTLRQGAQQRAERLETQVRWGGLSLLALLVLLSLAVVEPTARALARHLRRLADQSLELQRLALVAENTTALVVITDPEDRVIWINEAFTRVCGWTLEDALGKTPPTMLAHPHEDLTVAHRVKQALRLGQGVRQEWLRRARDGRDVWLDIDLRPLHDEDGHLSGFVRVSTDVTARVQQQRKLQALWAALPAGVVVQSDSGAIVDANRAAERQLGMSLAQMQEVDSPEASWRTVHEDLSPYALEDHPSMRTLRTGEPLFNETIGVHTPEGALRWLVVNTEPQRDSQGQVCGVITCFTDVTDSRVLQQRLRESSRTDALTQLPNRSVVMERLQQAIRHARRHSGYGFAVLFMDFDRFKQVNDTLGHGAGDELLRQVASRLRETLRPGDAVARVESDAHVAARVGGDEFVVVLEGVSDAGTVTGIAERLLDELGEPYLIAGAPLHSSVSIGVVRYHRLPDAEGSEPAVSLAQLEAEAEEMLRNADTAMYEAKRAGRGRWVLFDHSMHDRVVRALAVEQDLREGLKRDELFVVYQPVVDLSTRAMISVEALVRWRHPTRGLVSPVEFIPVAEECGLIDAVGAVVLRKACAQFVCWRETLGAAAPGKLAVNLSRAQLKRSALVDDVRDMLAETAMPAECLELEVTESLAAQDERVQHTLRELKKLGVKLALDDFGTGYSSLACLHLMPVDTVKIDRSFVTHAETVEYHRVLIEATIRVARTLGMATVAEGIETEGQAELMTRLDCDRGQGYLFSRPLESADLEAWALGQVESSEFVALD